MSTTSEAPVLRFRIADVSVALDLTVVAGLVPRDEADAMRAFDPAPALGFGRTDAGNVAVLTLDPPVAVLVGNDAVFETWSVDRIAAMPRWLRRHVPPVLKRACGLGDDGRLVYILEPKQIDRQTRTKT